MPTLTPNLGLKKPVPNVETDWGFRLNETIDLLDGAAMTAFIGGADGIDVSVAGASVTVSGFLGRVLTISGALQSDISDNSALIVSVSGHLQNEIGNINVPAILGLDGISVISGSNTTTVSGFHNEVVALSGSLRNEIVSVSGALHGESVLLSGSLQSQINAIDNSVTLQDAYNNGTGFITTTSNKSVTISGAGGLVAVTGTFARSLRLPQFSRIRVLGLMEIYGSIQRPVVYVGKLIAQSLKSRDLNS